MRRGTLLLLASMAAMLVAATGVVLAATTWKPGPGASPNNDSYCGDAKSNIADALGGADTMFAKGGSDYLSGGEGNDAGTGNKDPNLGTPVTGLNCFGEEVPAAVRGGGDADFIGVDNVAGNIPGASDDGSDDLVGNEGNDEIADTKNSADDYDRVWGGTGAHVIDVADGDDLDVVDCGEGEDVDVKTDPGDTVWETCEKVNGVGIDKGATSETTSQSKQLSGAVVNSGDPPPEPAERGPKPNKQRS